MIDVSIIIVSFNTSELLNRCLKTVYADSSDISKEVIVIENASADGSREMLIEKWPQVRVILNDENRGYAPACNQGLREATGRYKLALNSDAFLLDDALSKMVNFMDQNPDVCALAPKLLNEDGSIQYACARRAPTFIHDFLYFGMIANYFPKLHLIIQRLEPEEFYLSTHDAEVLSGACMFYRTDTLEKVGLLDERLIIARDDIEWCMRAKRAGCRLVYYPKAEVLHLCCQSRKFDIGKQRINNIDTYFRYFEITYGFIAATTLKFAVIINVMLSVVKSIILAPVGIGHRSKIKGKLELLRISIQLAFKRK